MKNDSTDTANVNDGIPSESVKEATPEAKPEKTEIKARVDAMWEKMNKGISDKELKSLTKKTSSTVKNASKKTSSNWMSYLGLAPKTTGSLRQDVSDKCRSIVHNGTNDEVKSIAADALSAVKDDAAAVASARGRVAITEIRDFAGQEVEIKKLVETDSKEAYEKTKAPASSAIDAVLEQIKKKPKLSVLDKTKKDWVEFKEENKGLEDELDAYKKSSDQYLEKVSFLQRADYREFERERDVRLALQARKRPDMQEEP